MKLSCLQENLARALNVVNRAVMSRSTLPITQNVLLETDGGRLKLSTTDLTISMTTWIGSHIEEEGAVTVPARLLNEFVTSLPAERVDLEIVEKPLGLHIECAHTATNISGQRADEFPPIPAVDDGNAAKIDPAVFKYAIDRVAFAAAVEDSRPVLTGVRVDIDGQSVTMAAADGFRLAVHKSQLVEPVANNSAFTVPARTLNEVNRLLSSQKDPVEFLVSPVGKRIIFNLDAVEIVSTLIEGNFPNYNQLIPEKSESKAVIRTGDLLQATRMAGVFARNGAGNSGIIKMELEQGEGETEGRIKVSSKSEEIGDSEGVIFANLEGEDGKIAYNFKYLSDAVEALGDETIIMETSSPSSPGVFRPGSDSDSSLVVIMPMYISW